MGRSSTAVRKSNWNVVDIPSSYLAGVDYCREDILYGKMIAIDPSSRSIGYAIFDRGILVDYGTIEATGSNLIQDRIRSLHDALDGHFGDEHFDCLVLEKIGPPNGRTHMLNYMKLIKSIGMILAAVRSDSLLEVNPSTWQKLLGDTYEKTDSNDALMIGKCAIHLATQIERDRLGSDYSEEMSE